MASTAPQAPDRPGAHERHIARSTVAQQCSQAVGVVAMLIVVTVVGRSLSLSAFGVYGLLISIAAYLLIVQSSVEGATVRAIASATEDVARNRVFSTALVVYAAAGVACGAVVALGGLGLVELLGIPPDLLREAREGIVALGVVMAIGWPAKVFQDALRGSQRFVAAAWAEVLAQVAFVAGMVGLVVAGAPLWTLIALGGSLPVLIGFGSVVVLTLVRAPFRFRRALVGRDTARELMGFSAYLSVIGVADLVVYAIDRVVLAAFRGPAAVGLYEAAVRPHSLVRQLHSTLMLTVVPVASGYLAEGDEWRLRELIVRGTRYVMAVMVPVTVALMALSGPILAVWLGDRFDQAAPAMAIFVSYWLLNAGSGVGSAVLVAAGEIRILTLVAWVSAPLNLVLALILTPLFGVTGLVLATTGMYVLMFPWIMQIIVSRLPVRIGDLVREAWVPAYTTGAVLAVALVALRLTVPLTTIPAVFAVAAGSVLLAWAAYYAVWLRPNERVLVRDFFRRRAPV